MNDKEGTAGSDGDWIETNGVQHTSFDECKRYCLRTDICVAVHFQQTYCFVYIRTTNIISKENAIYSKKHCTDSQSK